MQGFKVKDECKPLIDAALEDAYKTLQVIQAEMEKDPEQAENLARLRKNLGEEEYQNVMRLSLMSLMAIRVLERATNPMLAGAMAATLSGYCERVIDESARKLVEETVGQMEAIMAAKLAKTVTKES